MRRKDSLIKSTGAARYTQDVQLPDMLVAVVAHAPRFGGKVKSFDADAAKKVAGSSTSMRFRPVSPSSPTTPSPPAWAARS